MSLLISLPPMFLYMCVSFSLPLLILNRNIESRARLMDRLSAALGVSRSELEAISHQVEQELANSQSSSITPSSSLDSSNNNTGFVHDNGT